MDVPDADGRRDPGEAMRERLYGLAETQGWAHHVGDPARGEVTTTLLDRPVAPRGRIERLAHLGHPYDVVRGEGPSVRLTARRPWQGSPEAYLVAANPTVYLPFDDTVVWEVPQEHGGSPLRGVDFHFAQSPSEPSLMSLSLSGKAWPGRRSHVELAVGGLGPRLQIPIGEDFAVHTVDVAVPPGGPGFLDAGAVIAAGVELLAFRWLTFGPGFIVYPPLFE